ncbi:GntR family transcriptional regulator [Aurantimonas sp. HBX-1]|uniref:GntR family transcriptional regulator n=1 Tax=Aurantimonas sp. HBX-1 TaxID=2906072 RepID=UPI001F2AC011|nr:GntR family transcriptional regulator [Aurantimonas sp. HBX-1]UIJ72649.1 GntR family transcriptional regulator [Aurantimonas sp. HBX-1]
MNDLSGTEPVSVYGRLRADIIFGRLAPGARLPLESLRAGYGAGAGQLREALNRLASERLVVAEGQRGFQVTPVSVANLREIADLRLLLECDALEQSFQAGDTAWEGRVLAAHHMLSRMEAAMAAGDGSHVEKWKQHDWLFHQALISACPSQVMKETHAASFDKYLRYQMIALSFRGDVAAAEHRLMLECALGRDASGACDVLRRHVEGGVAHALATGTIRS